MTTDKKDRIPNAPDLRFPGFKESWTCTTINEVCLEFQSGKSITADTIHPQGSFPVYGGNGLRGYSETYNHEGDYVLIGRQGALCGNVRFVTGKTYITEHAIAAKATDANDTRFLQFLFSKMNLGQYSDQSAQPGLAVNKLLKLKIQIPQKEEQLKIARFLSLLQKRLETQSRAIEKYESLINGLQESILWKDYKRVSFSEIFIERNERTNVANQYEVLSSTIKGIFRQSDYFDKEVASVNNVGYKVLYKGDIVLSPQNLWLGNINYNDSFEIGMVSPSYKVFYINDTYNPFYISCFLKTHKALYEYACASEQGASIVRRNLDLDAFMAISIPIPSIEVQNRIAKVFSLLYQKHKTEIQILEKLNKQKEFLLSQMFI